MCVGWIHTFRPCSLNEKEEDMLIWFVTHKAKPSKCLKVRSVGKIQIFKCNCQEQREDIQEKDAITFSH